MALANTSVNIWLKPLATSFIMCGTLLLLLLAVPCSLSATGEFYSSVDSLKQLGAIEATLLQGFRKYLKEQQQHLAVLRRFMERIRVQHSMATEDMKDYLENPINAFKLIKRVVRDWSGVNDVLTFQIPQNELTELLTQLKESSNLPAESELRGAILGLARLQDIYNLNAEDMANGKRFGSALSWRDCLEIGASFNDYARFDLALMWLKIAKDRLGASEETRDFKQTFSNQIQEHLAYALQPLGYTKEAMKQLSEAVELNYNHPIHLTKEYFSKLPEEEEIYKPVKEGDYHPNYAALCRGEKVHSSQLLQSSLKCHLDFSVHPYFILSPLQVEPVLMDPLITMYHNMLNDDQIARLVNKTMGQLERSQVNVEENEAEILEIRVSQQIWLRQHDNPTTAFMYRLVSLISGFNITNTEEIQVANYGIGGQYVPHHDYFDLDLQPQGCNGNRIATNMFYLSNVDIGGFTIFTMLNVYLKPVTGSMVMWYNLHKSLEPDERTKHAGCPVVKGSKRIANIWTHSDYQDTARPCGLHNDKVKI